MVPNEKANERQSASLTPSDWSFFCKTRQSRKIQFSVRLVSFLCLFTCLVLCQKDYYVFAVFLPFSESIIYSRYNAWIGRILSAWAPRLWQGLEREWKLFSRRNEFWGFEYVSGFLISGGGKALQWKNTDIRNVSHFGNMWEKSTNWTLTKKWCWKRFMPLVSHLLPHYCHEKLQMGQCRYKWWQAKCGIQNNCFLLEIESF